MNELHEGFRQLARAGVTAVMWEEMAQVIVRNCLRLAIVDMVATIGPAVLAGGFATGGVMHTNRAYRVGEGSPVYDSRKHSIMGVRE